MEHNGAHDNTNIRVSNSFNGNMVLVGGVYVGGVSSAVILLFMFTHWQAAIIISAVLVYGLLSMLGLVLFAGIAALWIRFVVVPMRNKILHKQDNAIVIINALGNVEVVPLLVGLKPTIVESDPTSELAIVDMHNHNVNQKTIAEGLGISQSTVSRVITKHKKETGG